MQFTDEQQRFIDEHYQLLPVDADGVPIRVGDRLNGYGTTLIVVEMCWDGDVWAFHDLNGEYWEDCAAFTHSHEPTIEDVLREFAREIDADAYGITDAKVAEFAAKLRLAGSDAE